MTTCGRKSANRSNEKHDFVEEHRGGVLLQPKIGALRLGMTWRERPWDGVSMCTRIGVVCVSHPGSSNCKVDDFPKQVTGGTVSQVSVGSGTMDFRFTIAAMDFCPPTPRQTRQCEERVFAAMDLL